MVWSVNQAYDGYCRNNPNEKCSISRLLNV